MDTSSCDKAEDLKTDHKQFWPNFILYHFETFNYYDIFVAVLLILWSMSLIGKNAVPHRIATIRIKLSGLANIVMRNTPPRRARPAETVSLAWSVWRTDPARYNILRVHPLYTGR